MADDERWNGAPRPEAPGPLGAAPSLPRISDEPAAAAGTHPDLGLEDRPTASSEPRLNRLVDWLRWAAAPLGFFLFLAALTLHGLTVKDESSGAGDLPAARPAPSISAPVSTATTAQVIAVATTVPQAPTTTAATPQEPPTTTATVVTSAPEGDGTQAPTPTTAARFGPVCGFTPGETVRIRINGQPAPPVTAGANGCVSASR